MITGKDPRPVFKGAVTVYSAPLTPTEEAALTPAQARSYDKNGKMSLMISMRDGVEMNVPGCAGALAAIITAFMRGMPETTGGPEAKHRARRATLDQILVMTVLAFEAGEVIAEGLHN